MKRFNFNFCVLVFLFSTFAYSQMQMSLEVTLNHHVGYGGEHNSLVQVDSDTYALAYGNANIGYISTFTISADGLSITKVATLEHDSYNGTYNSLVQVDSADRKSLHCFGLFWRK